MKLHTPRPNTSINVGDMKDGEIGVITNWGTADEGRIVQRYGEDLVTLGSGRNDSWSGVFGEYFLFPHDGKHTVEILPPGTLLEI